MQLAPRSQHGAQEFQDLFHIIYVEAGSDWNASSPVVACFEPDGGSLPRDAAGMEYFLEVHISKEALNIWRKWRGGGMLTFRKNAKRLSTMPRMMLFYQSNMSILQALQRY